MTNVNRNSEITKAVQYDRRRDVERINKILSARK